MSKIKYREEFEAAFKGELSFHRGSNGSYFWADTILSHHRFCRGFHAATALHDANEMQKKAKRLDAVIACLEEKLTKLNKAEDKDIEPMPPEYRIGIDALNFGEGSLALEILELAKGEKEDE